jgi:hypothetical protein
VAFNPSPAGDARFSPLVIDGQVVPVLYAGTTVEVALMETLMRDLPSPSQDFIFTLPQASGPLRVAQLHTAGALRLADLGTLGLRRLGLTRGEAIDCDSNGYPGTRALAAWLYRHRPEVQGLLWTSRQDDRAQAVVLFEPRLPPDALHVDTHDESLTAGAHLDTLAALCDRLGVMLYVSEGR